MTGYWIGFFVGAFIAESSSLLVYGKTPGRVLFTGLNAVGAAVALVVYLS